MGRPWPQTDPSAAFSSREEALQLLELPDSK